ncbi:thioredoxin family protein [Candidatus Poribacteria bacterium]|nr:thioredoxin family protein [Candidatus Poribacteria bacterium]
MVLEVFKSSNCPFCPRAIRIAEAVLSSHNDIWLQVVDVRQNRQRARKMKIRAVPTLVFNNEVIYVGSPTIDELDKKLREVKNSTKTGTPE